MATISNAPSRLEKIWADLNSLATASNSSGVFGLKERLGGLLGLAGTVTSMPEFNISEKLRAKPAYAAETTPTMELLTLL